MGQNSCFSSQIDKQSTMTKKQSVIKLSTIKLKILVDSWFPNSIDLTKNTNRVSSIFFLRKNEISEYTTTSTLTLNPQTTHKLKQNVTECPQCMKNSLKITADQACNFIIQSLDSNMHFWRFVKQWCQLKVNDQFFINGIQYKLTKLIHDYKNLEQAGGLKKKYSIKQEQDKISPCKICFESTFDKKNMLMSPCRCTGSMANVHTKCLASWILDNNQSQQNVFSADLKKQKCQICNQNYLQSKAFEQILDNFIFQKQGLQTPYAILEGISIKQNKSYKSVLVVSFKNKNQFKINGKASLINNQLNEQLNYQIKYQKGEVYIKNSSQKFGLGILAQFPLKIIKDKQQQSLMVNHNMIISFYVLNKGNNTTTEFNSSIEQTSNNLMNMEN